MGVGPVSTLLSSPLGLVGPSGELGFLVQSAVIKHYVTSLIAHSSGGSGAHGQREGNSCITGTAEARTEYEDERHSGGLTFLDLSYLS